MRLIERVKQLAREITPEVISIRRHLHAHPELSFEEYETVAYVRQQLDRLGITDISPIAGTGLIAQITGTLEPSEQVFALRADMDALPIIEANQVPYASTKPGVMHACGHDAHTASLLGVAAILQKLRPEFKGNFRLLFQPGEEKSPGGASLLIKEGALENPTPMGILGQHVMPLIPAGKVGFREGMYMASTDEIFIKVIGKGGHGAMPEQNIDPVLIASHLVVALQQVVSRVGNPKIPSVLSIGKFIANGATNVIPNEVNLEGTFRTMDEAWRAKALASIISLTEGLVSSMGGRAEIRIQKGYPYLENDPALTRATRAFAVEYMGEENVLNLDRWMAGEDFAFYTHHLPGCFYRLGTRNEEKGIVSSVHTATFDIDESALETGCGLMTWLALKNLGNE